MADKKSGVDSLIDALKASGAPVDEKGGAASSSSSTSSKSDSNAKQSSSTSNANQQEQAQTGGLSDIPKAILDLPVMERFKNMKKKGKIITAIVVILILGIAY